jgi:phosphate acetyltransferase
MAEQGQINSALLDGPLALDNAVSSAAACVKGMTSPVAGDTRMLLCCDCGSQPFTAETGGIRNGFASA